MTTTLRIAALALVWAAASPAHACSCLSIDVPTAFGRADAVFEGRVLEVERGEGPTGSLRVTMEVVQQWKGIESERVIVETAADPGMCGVAFVPDTSWLVYAVREGGTMTTTLCSRTALVLDAEEDLAELGAGVVPVDIDDDDEVEEPRERPARGGCASCAVAPREPAPLAPLSAALVLALAVARRCRARRGV